MLVIQYLLYLSSTDFCGIFFAFLVPLASTFGLGKLFIDWCIGGKKMIELEFRCFHTCAGRPGDI